ncbi:MAG: hypothetical protein M0Z41_16015 [Peptococcaceae bacterium]|jgi:hypothetical protein|nr:hypothetical protein [Peptococcaceae bacterium]
MTAREKTQQRKINNLGCRDPKCQICGESDIVALTLVSKNQLSHREQKCLLEIHHIAGRHEGDTIVVCQNCHVKLSNAQIYWPKKLMEKNRTRGCQMLAELFGIGDIFGLKYSDPLLGLFKDNLKKICEYIE